jgi:hypothetical protein
MLSKSKKSDIAYITTLLNAISPKIYKEFMTAVKKLRSQQVVSEIVRLIEIGQFTSAFDIIEKTITGFASSTILMYSLVGQSAAKEISELLNIEINFNIANDRAVRLMQSTRLRLVSDISSDQRQAIRSILTTGIAQGLNPKESAKDLSLMLGLSARQVEQVKNYRRILELNSAESLTRSLRDRRFDRTIENSLDTGVALTTSQIDRMVNRYAERQLDYRARVIARTESLRVVHEGNEEMFNQAVDAGDISPLEIKREWVTAADERVRGSHASMHGQIRPFGQPFISGDGNGLRYPGDIAARPSEVINCRCVVITTLK